MQLAPVPMSKPLTLPLELDIGGVRFEERRSSIQ